MGIKHVEEQSVNKKKMLQCVRVFKIQWEASMLFTSFLFYSLLSSFLFSLFHYSSLFYCDIFL